MKKILLFAGICFLSYPVHAALRLGLGQAVAKRSADLIQKASGADPANAVGDAVRGTLPECSSSAIYDSLPTELSMIAGIDPLGHVAPSPHTFPSDHIYFYPITSSPVTPPVYAPGHIHIVDVASTDYLSASPVFTDYSLVFYGCRDLKSYYSHVRTLSSEVLVKLGTAAQHCSTYSTGGSTYRRCDADVNIEMESGELMGYAASSGAFDFGSYDYRQSPLAFATPARHPGDQPYTVCPLNYFTSSLRTSMEGLLGSFNGSFRRTYSPACGQINFDVSGTAQGDWYHIGSPDSPEDPHAALIVNNVYAPKQTISYGTSLPSQAPNFYTFSPVSAGFVNRDFSQVTADGQLYCYDTFFDPLNNPIGGGPTFIIQMLTSTTLRIERQAASSCGAGPWSFTANTADFQR